MVVHTLRVDLACNGRILLQPVQQHLPWWKARGTGAARTVALQCWWLSTSVPPCSRTSRHWWQRGGGWPGDLGPPAQEAQEGGEHWVGIWTIPNFYFYMLESRLLNLEASCALNQLDTKSSVH